MDAANLRQKMIRTRHRKSFLISKDQAKRDVDDLNWLVLSKKEGDPYHVEIGPNTTPCCEICCTDCKPTVCIHMFSCTCADYVGNNMLCKHIHLVHRILRGEGYYEDYCAYVDSDVNSEASSYESDDGGGLRLHASESSCCSDSDDEDYIEDIMKWLKHVEDGSGNWEKVRDRIMRKVYNKVLLVGKNEAYNALSPLLKMITDSLNILSKPENATSAPDNDASPSTSGLNDGGRINSRHAINPFAVGLASSSTSKQQVEVVTIPSSPEHGHQNNEEETDNQPEVTVVEVTTSVESGHCDNRGEQGIKAEDNGAFVCSELGMVIEVETEAEGGESDANPVPSKKPKISN